MNDIQAITALIQQYWNALYEGDVPAFQQVMHPAARLYCATDGELLHMDVASYLDLVQGRPSPASRQDARYDRILAIEVASPSTAHVRVEDAYLPRRFTDDLTLVKIDGRWWIVSKVWHYVVDKRNGDKPDLHPA